MRPPAKISFFLCCLALPAFAQTQVSSRTDSATREVQSVRLQRALAPKTDANTVPELYPGEAADVGTQTILLSNARPSLFEAAIDVQYFYTSNAYLTERGNADTGILVTTLQAAFTPTPFTLGEGQLALRAGYRHQRYNYGLDKTSNQLNNLDFDSGTAFINGRYSFGQNWAAYAGVDYNRLIGHEDNWSEFYTELAPAWGIERQFPLGDKQLISLAYVGAYHWTYADQSPDTNSNDRLDSILALSYSIEVLPKLILQPYYRFQHSHYTQNSSRNDIYHTVGASALYMINDWASIRIFANWEVRNSNDTSIYDYQKLDTGGGLSILLRF